MQHRTTRTHESAKRAQPERATQPGTRESGHAVIEQIERSESLPATLSASQAFAVVMSTLVQHLPRDQADDFVERHLPSQLRTLIRGASAQHAEDAGDGDAAEYVEVVSDQLQIDDSQADELARVVIGALRLLMSAEEVDAIAAELPPGLESMWRQASDVEGAPGHSGLP